MICDIHKTITYTKQNYDIESFYELHVWRCVDMKEWPVFISCQKLMGCFV